MTLSSQLRRRPPDSAIALSTVLILALASWPISAAPSSRGVHTTSHYLTTRDGTRLAVDVHLPASREAGREIPALLVLTRYWRSSEDPSTGVANPALSPLDRFFIGHGYAIVKVDVRGSGASFGTRPAEYGQQEVRDGWDVVDWVVNQPWCDGNVGAFGTSYTGTTAELLAASGHPAVKAVIPGWSDFDMYLSPVRPYGLLATSFIREWGALVGWQDDNASDHLGASVRRVDADADGEMLAAAVEEHRSNPDVYEAVRSAEFRDDVFAGTSVYANGPLYWKEAIERSRVPMLVLVSWLDAGTIDGALQRFRHLGNPQKLVIMATNHGGALHASPFEVGRDTVPPKPSIEEQFELRLAFFDQHMKGGSAGVDAWPAVRYYNLGEEAFREADSWPPGELSPERWYFRKRNGLSTQPPATDPGVDRYEIDFTVTTGATNRWKTQMGEAVLGLSDRGAMDARMLSYTSEPLAADLQVAGAPVVSLSVASDHDDGAFLAYLEVVDEDGRSRYVTEGGLRAIHRKPWHSSVFGDDGPLHSFRRGDRMPLVPGDVVTLTFRMWPTAVLIRKGQRIRIAIAGADADTFDRVPAEGTPTISVYRSVAQPSFVDLPTLRE